MDLEYLILNSSKILALIGGIAFIVTIIIEVIKEGISFDYPINVITTEISDSKIFFNYSLDSEEELENTIIIEF